MDAWDIIITAPKGSGMLISGWNFLFDEVEKHYDKSDCK